MGTREDGWYLVEAHDGSQIGAWWSDDWYLSPSDLEPYTQVDETKPVIRLVPES
jgi:hypothetical protein